MPRRPTRFLLPAALLGYFAFLSGLALLLTEKMHGRIFAESGPFEWGSLVLWLLSGVAVLILLKLRVSVSLVIALLITILVCAAREADLHKAFTDSSVLKIDYYTDGDVPLARRAGFGAIMVLLLLAVGHVGREVVRHVRARSGPPRGWESSILFGLALIILTKTADRAPDVLESWFGLAFTETTSDHFQAFEEGMELLVPLFVVIAIALFARDGFALEDDDPADAAPAEILCRVQWSGGYLPGEPGGGG